MLSGLTTSATYSVLSVHFLPSWNAKPDDLDRGLVGLERVAHLLPGDAGQPFLFGQRTGALDQIFLQVVRHLFELRNLRAARGLLLRFGRCGSGNQLGQLALLSRQQVEDMESLRIAAGLDLGPQRGHALDHETLLPQHRVVHLSRERRELVAVPHAEAEVLREPVLHRCQVRQTLLFAHVGEVVLELPRQSLERPIEEGPRLSRLRPGIKERGKIVQRQGHERMVGAERLLLDRQRALVERLGLGVAALVRSTARPDCSGRGDIRMVRAQRLLVIARARL